MANRQHMKDWQNRIATVCTRRLQRSLTEEESAYIASHVGFMALEGVEDAVKTLSLDALEELLNSKNS
ncbi:MAG: hypothetical protein AMS22_02975 [Thiotrichales bacterium SG8_50]|nr:MAG: hypothetical protein AMS22_02975 [Thiotrichales bacterium SG8_50]